MNILIASVHNIRTNEIKVLAEEMNKSHKVSILSHAEGRACRGLAFRYKEEPVMLEPLLYKDVVKNTGWVWKKDIQQIKSEAKSKVDAFDGIVAYGFHGEPAESMAIMLNNIMEHKQPDLVICGIGNGAMLGQDIYCSSYIGMAMEAAFNRVPVIVVSVGRHVGGHGEDTLKPTVDFISKNLEKIIAVNAELPPHTFLTFNFPVVKKVKDYKGVKVTRLGAMSELSKYVEKVDTDGHKYYWADYVERKNVSKGDENAGTWFDRGYITVTPINYDSTDYELLKKFDFITKRQASGGEK